MPGQFSDEYHPDEQGSVLPTQTIAPPIDASGTATAAVVRTLIMQIVGAVGMLITVLGLAETSWIVQAYRFVRSEDGTTVVALIASIVVMVWQLYSKVREHRKLQVLALVSPNSIAIAPANPAAGVQKAADEAIHRALNDPSPVGQAQS